MSDYLLDVLLIHTAVESPWWRWLHEKASPHLLQKNMGRRALRLRSFFDKNWSKHSRRSSVRLHLEDDLAVDSHHQVVGLYGRVHPHFRLREDVLDDPLGEVGFLESASGRAVLDCFGRRLHRFDGRGQLGVVRTHQVRCLNKYTNQIII